MAPKTTEHTDANAEHGTDDAKRIEYIDGVRVLFGYSDAEYRELIQAEALKRHRRQRKLALYWQH